MCWIYVQVLSNQRWFVEVLEFKQVLHQLKFPTKIDISGTGGHNELCINQYIDLCCCLEGQIHVITEIYITPFKDTIQKCFPPQHG